jgi:NADH-quinone oxidoreductase subunit G
MTTTTSDPKAAAPDAKPAAAPVPAPAPAPPSDSVTLTIDGQKITVKKGTLVVEAAKLLQNDVPVFCYHPKLKPVGACRMCLVEIEKMPRLQTACTSPVAEGMVVKTKSEMAVGGQNAVVTLLLANHPLDCPVCDKAGECPLQDNTFEHGLGVSRFEEDKREKDKAFELSDRIVLDRERCILCYRCVRFHEEIPGDRALAVLDRGSYGEIGVAEGERYTSPLQGNVIDICPVGALTSRQYRFRARPWDLRRAKGIAKDDPTGSNLWIDTRDGRVLRLRPRENLEVNDVWLADKTRFDTMPLERTERRGMPLIRKDGVLVETTWFDALRKAANMMRHHKVGALASTTLTNEAMAALKLSQLTATTSVWPRISTWAPRGTLQSLAGSKSVVVVGCDPFVDAPILALHIRRALVPFTQGGQTKGGGGNLVVVGAENGLFRDSKAWLKTSADNTLTVLKDLVAALEGKGSKEAATAAAFLKERPASIVAGTAIATDPEGIKVLEQLRTLLGCSDETSFTAGLDTAANAFGARAIFGDVATVDATGPAGVLSQKNDTLMVLGDVPHVAGFPVKDTGTARVIWATATLLKDATDIPATVDVVLPLADTYEQAGSFTSIEGRHQGFDAGGIPPGGADKAKADWEIVALLSNELGMAMPKDLKGLRAVFAADHAFGRLPPNKNTSPYVLNVM